MSSENPKQSDSWQDCPQGEVGNLVSSLCRQKRNQRIVRGTAVIGFAVMLIAVGFTLSHFMSQPTDPLLQGKGPRYAGICCEKVQLYGKEYLAGTLDTKISHHIDGHLEECKHCRTKFEKMKDLLQTSLQLLPLEQFALLR